MAIFFNQPQIKTRRQELRTDSTKAEKILWKELKGKKILGHKFRRQHSIGSYIVDFYCAELRLVIEVDGDSHLQPEAIYYDARRDGFMQLNNIRCLRVTNSEVYQDLENVIQKIQSCIKELVTKS